MSTRDQLIVEGSVVPGHGVAGSASPSSPYPAGTIVLQAPFFRDLGLDLSGFRLATLNVSTAPVAIRIVRPTHHFANVAWTPIHAPESFDFVRTAVIHEGLRHEAWGYRPTADTKAGHWQSTAVLEVIAPPVPGIGYGSRIALALDPDEVVIEEIGRG